MSIGFPARFTETRTFSLAEDELAAAVESALVNLGWSYKAMSGREFLASVPISGWTWGEEFRVRILAGGAVEAESKCVTVRLPQVFDFGRNRQNVETFFGLVERGAKQGEGEKPVSANVQEPAAQGKPAAPGSRLAGNLIGGCLIGSFILIALVYFVAAVVGLLTGNLYLPGRGSGGGVIHGPWARISALAILAVFAWAFIWAVRNRRKSRRP